jgi:hypothetical protein
MMSASGFIGGANNPLRSENDTAHNSNALRAYNEAMRPIRSHIETFVIAALAVLALPLAYAASEGPAIWLARRELVEPQSVDRLYRPLMLAGRAMPTIDNLRHRYLDLWRPPPTACGPVPR